jgi:hypothetical protein
MIRYIFYAFSKANLLKNETGESLEERMIKVMLALDSVYETLPEISARCLGLGCI